MKFYKSTISETGEDYAEQVCIYCGKWHDKDLLQCLHCFYFYKIIKKFNSKKLRGGDIVV